MSIQDKKSTLQHKEPKYCPYLQDADSWYLWEYREHPEVLDLYDPERPLTFIDVQYALNRLNKGK